MQKLIYILAILMIFSSCKIMNDADQGVDEDKLGIIDADVRSADTHLKHKAVYEAGNPGEGDPMTRSFENAPPMIPHTTKGFFPIKKDNNICLSCHMPDKAKEVEAVALPKTHFMDLRPQMVEKDGVYVFEDETKVTMTDLDHLNSSYFNCSLCHAPQAAIKVDIENLFTPEFRNEFGFESSDLNKRIEEGI